MVPRIKLYIQYSKNIVDKKKGYTLDTARKDFKEEYKNFYEIYKMYESLVIALVQAFTAKTLHNLKQASNNLTKAFCQLGIYLKMQEDLYYEIINSFHSTAPNVGTALQQYQQDMIKRQDAQAVYFSHRRNVELMSTVKESSDMLINLTTGENFKRLIKKSSLSQLIAYEETSEEIIGYTNKLYEVIKDQTYDFFNKYTDYFLTTEFSKISFSETRVNGLLQSVEVILDDEYVLEKYTNNI